MPDLPQRKSLRLKGFDYANHHTWHVVIRLHETAQLLGQLTEAGLQLSASGRLVERLWLEMPQHYPCVWPDCHAIMEDHVHLLFGLTEPQLVDPAASPQKLDAVQAIHRFKSYSTRLYRELIGGDGNTKLWRRSFWDEAIRSDRQLEACRRYVLNNARREWLERQGLV
jgi:REP element-mobilizing transposase RayT